MDDECGFVVGSVVSSVVAGHAAGDGVGLDASHSAGADREARCEIVNQMVETTEGLLDAERRDEFRDFGVVVTHVVAEASFGLQRVGSLRAEDNREDRTTVFLAVRFSGSAFADELEVQRVEDLVADVGGRSVVNVSTTHNEVINEVNFGDLLALKQRCSGGSLIDDGHDRSTGSKAGNKVRCGLLVLVTVTVFPCVTARLSEEVKDSTKLLLTVSGEAEVFQRDAWRLDNSAADAVLLELLAELDVRTLVTVTSTASTLDVIGSVFEGLVEVRSVERVGASVECAQVAPCNTSSVASIGGCWDRTVIDQSRQLIAHAFREGRLFDEVHPRRSVEGTLVDVLTDAVSFFGEDGVDCTDASAKIECRHSIKKLGLKKGLVWFALLSTDHVRTVLWHRAGRSIFSAAVVL